jgi:hypothetical protein
LFCLNSFAVCCNELLDQHGCRRLLLTMLLCVLCRLRGRQAVMTQS